MRKYVFILMVSIISIAVFTQCSNSKKESEAIDPQLKSEIEKINLFLPMKIGEVISMDSVTISDDKQMKYYYTFLQQPEVADKAIFEKNALPPLIEMAKGADMKVFRDADISFHFIYLLPDGSPYQELFVTPDMYK